MGTIDDQMAFHAEALRRAASRNGGDPRAESLEGASRVAGLQIGDMWKSGGDMPGFMSTDGQGPTTPLTFEDAAKTGRTTANFDDIMRNAHNPKR